MFAQAADDSSGIISLTRCSSPSVLPSSSYGPSSATDFSSSAASVSASTPNPLPCPRSNRALEVLLPNQEAVAEPRQPWIGPLPHAQDLKPRAQAPDHATTSMADWLPCNTAAAGSSTSERLDKGLCSMAPCETEPKRQAVRSPSVGLLVDDAWQWRQANSFQQANSLDGLQHESMAASQGSTAGNCGAQETRHAKRHQVSFQSLGNPHAGHAVGQGPHVFEPPACRADLTKSAASFHQPQQHNPFQDLTNRQNQPKALVADQAALKPAKPCALAGHDAENERAGESDGVSSAAKRHCSERCAARFNPDMLAERAGTSLQQSFATSNNLHMGKSSAVELGTTRSAAKPKAAIACKDLENIKPVSPSVAALAFNRLGAVNLTKAATPRGRSACSKEVPGTEKLTQGTSKTSGNPSNPAVPGIDLQRVRAASMAAIGSHRDSARGSSKAATPREPPLRPSTAERLPGKRTARARTDGTAPRGTTPRGRQACADQPRSAHAPPRKWISSTKTDSKAVTPEVSPHCRDQHQSHQPLTPRWLSSTQADSSKAATPDGTPRGQSEASCAVVRTKSAAAQSLADSLKRRASLNSLRSSTARHAAKKRSQSHSSCTEDSGSVSLGRIAAANRVLKQPSSGACSAMDRSPSLGHSQACESVSMRHTAAAGQAQVSRAGAHAASISLAQFAAAYRASKKAALQASGLRETERSPSQTEYQGSVGVDVTVRPVRAFVTRYAQASPETPSALATRRIPSQQDLMESSSSPQQSSPDAYSDEASSLDHQETTPIQPAKHCSSHAQPRLPCCETFPSIGKYPLRPQHTSQDCSHHQSSLSGHSNGPSSEIQEMSAHSREATWSSHASKRPPRLLQDDATPMLARRVTELQAPIQSFSPEQSSPDLVYSDEASSSDLRSQPSAKGRWQGMRLSNSPLYEPSLKGSDGPRPQCFLRDLRHLEEGMEGPESLRESGSTTTEIVWSAAFNACSNPTFCPSLGEPLSARVYPNAGTHMHTFPPFPGRGWLAVIVYLAKANVCLNSSQACCIGQLFCPNFDIAKAAVGPAWKRPCPK